LDSCLVFILNVKLLCYLFALFDYNLTSEFPIPNFNLKKTLEKESEKYQGASIEQ